MSAHAATGRNPNLPVRRPSFGLSSRGIHNATLADQRANVLVKHLRGEQVLRHASLQGYWEENDANSEKGD